MALVPSGHDDRSNSSVISAIWAPSRTSMSWWMASPQAFFSTSEDGQAHGLGDVEAHGELDAPLAQGVEEAMCGTR